MRHDIAGYSKVMAELAAAGKARAEVLARHQLDEQGWEEIDSHWQERLSEALEGNEDGAPALVSEYAAAYAAAQGALAPPLSIEQFAQVTRLLQASGDLQASLARVGVSLADYVRANEHWSGQMAQDPELERRFEAALRGP